jgi:hypothetical protein
MRHPVNLAVLDPRGRGRVARGGKKRASVKGAKWKTGERADEVVVVVGRVRMGHVMSRHGENTDTLPNSRNIIVGGRKAQTDI